MIERVRFENFKSLQNVTLELGRLTALVGPNGCGKSSVLQGIRLLSISARPYVDGTDHPAISPRLMYRGEPGKMVLAMHASEGVEMRVELRAPAGKPAMETVLQPSTASTASDLRPIVIDGRTIKPQGLIAGEPLKPEAGMWRRALLLLHNRRPRPEVVVIVRDLDGYPGRRAGIEQVCNRLPWSFAIVAATPEPEIEAWIASGFVPTNDDERDRLAQAHRELSFDPALQSQRLTSHPNTAATDAKRVLARLCDGDRDRERACLVPHVLHERGTTNGARAFLDDVDHRIVPCFGDRA